MTDRPTSIPREIDDAADDLEEARNLADLVRDALRFREIDVHDPASGTFGGAAIAIRMITQRIDRVREDLSKNGCLGRAQR